MICQQTALNRATFRAADLTGGVAAPGSVDHDQRMAFLPGLIQGRVKVSAGWAPESPNLRSMTKNGTPLTPSARPSCKVLPDLVGVLVG